MRNPVTFFSLLQSTQQKGCTPAHYELYSDTTATKFPTRGTRQESGLNPNPPSALHPPYTPLEIFNGPPLGGCKESADS